MANSLALPRILARENLSILSATTVAPALYYRDNELDFRAVKQGTTVQIKRPATYTVNKHTHGNTVPTQDIVESLVPITLSEHYVQSILWSDVENTTSLTNLRGQVLEPAMTALAAEIDADALQLKNQLGYVAPVGTTVPGLPTGIGDIAKIRQFFTTNNVPRPWYVIVSAAYETALLSIEEFVLASNRGDQGRTLLTGEFGSAMGMTFFLAGNMNVSPHTPGTMTSANTNGAIAKGATTITLDGVMPTNGTLTAGDMVGFGTHGSYAVRTAVQAASGEVTFTLTEPVRSAIPNDTAMTIFQGGGSAYVKGGMAFNPNAVSFASLPLEFPENDPRAFAESANGIAIRVMNNFRSTHRDFTLDIDVLGGSAVIDGNQAASLVHTV